MRRPLLPVIVLTVLGLGAAALPAPADAQAQTQPAPAVTVTPATMETLAVGDRFVGRIEAVNRVDLRARVSGFVQAVNFKEASSVAKDTVLFEIEPDAYTAAIAQIQGQITSAEAQKNLADINLQRQQELFERNTVAEVTVQEAEAQAGVAQGDVEQLQGALQQAQLNLSYTKITAPFDGRVGLTDISVGAFVGPESGALATLSSVDPIHATFGVAESILIDVRKRMATSSSDAVTVQIILANGDTYSHPGTITVVDTQVQGGTDSVLVRAAFPNPDGALVDGQLVTVTLSAEGQEPVLTVPVQALQRDQAGYFVLTVDDQNTVAKTPIQVARIEGAKVAVASGLSAGQQVITEGVQKARPGLVVDPHQADAASGAATE